MVLCQRKIWHISPIVNIYTLNNNNSWHYVNTLWRRTFLIAVYCYDTLRASLWRCMQTSPWCGFQLRYDSIVCIFLLHVKKYILSYRIITEVQQKSRQVVLCRCNGLRRYLRLLVSFLSDVSLHACVLYRIVSPVSCIYSSKAARR